MPKRPVAPDDDSESISSSSSEESSGEHEDNYENDGFVVPDEEVDEPTPEEAPPKVKKHKAGRIKKKPKPDPEDLELAGIRPIRANTMGDLEQQLFAEDDRTQVEPSRREERTEDIELDESEKDNDFFVNDEPVAPLSYDLEKYTPKEPEAPKAVFEPSDIIGRFGLPEDEVVRSTDLPERLQRNLKGRLDPTDEELDKETNWLLLKMISAKGQFSAEEVKTKIRHFLQLYRVDKFETAFIQTYRFNLLSPELADEDLWELTRYDLEWGFIFNQKKKTREILQEALSNTQSISTGGSAVPGKRMLLGGGAELPKDVVDLLEHTSDGNYYFELEDLAKFVETYLTPVESGEGFRRASARNRILTEGRRFRLHEFASHAGLSPSQLSQNIENNARLNPIPKNSVKPQELAFDYLCDEYKTETKVLKSLSDYMRTELTGDPTVRSFVRAKYGYYVRVYTSPTEKGKEVLDIFHPFYRAKSLGRLSSTDGEPKEGKDIDSFGKTDLWLEVSKCESDGLIRIDFTLPWSDSKEDKILNELKQFYLSGDAVEEVEAEWNEFRAEVLRQTLGEMYVALQGEYRRYLTTKAEENVLTKCREEYRKRLLQPPYIVHDEESSSPKVFSLVLDPSSPKFGITALVVLDSSGQVLDSTTLSAFLKWEKEVLQPTDRERHSNDVKTFQRMLLTYRPEVVVLSANCLQCVLLRRTVVLECRVMTRDGYEKQKVDWNVDPSALLEKMPDVVMGNTEVPRLFSDSHRGKRMLSDLSSLLRQAVSLGRQLQSPAAELLGLWQDPSENLTTRLNLHILQKLLPEKQLLNALEEAAVRVCAHIGADINNMLDNPHLRAPLCFVPGMGLIKAHFLFENLMRVGHIPVRSELLQNRLIEPRVFENCVGFIIVQGTDRSDPLDRTRIHPAHYEIAQTIAASALDSKDEKDERNIERVMKNPERLDKVELDFDAYASHLATKGRLKMREIIDMVVLEMKRPFAVVWEEFHDMDPLTAMYLASGETEYTLRKGVVVHAVVSSVVEDKPMRCRLESGLDASARGVSPDLKEGTTVRGRVTKIIAECKMPESLFFQIQLACTLEDLSNHMAYRMDILRLAELDPAFAENPLDWKEVQLVEEETKNGQKYIPRLINHPKFRNVGLNTAVTELERKDIGECIFRPSSRGQDHITCTFKFYDFVCSHLDIVEEGKPADNMLGSRFKIGEDVYESLQEIIERYVVPVSTLTKDAITHKKFLDLTGRGSEQIEATIRQEKQASPNSIPYYFTILPSYPQFFVLFYMPKQHVIKEYIKVKPKGLFFHERFHSNMNYLVAWFKKHYSEQTYQSFLKRSVAPKVISDNIFAIPSKKSDRPMTPRRTDDRYENAGRSSPAYSSRADPDRPRHTPRHEIEASDDPWRTPQQSDPWKQSPWGSSRTPVEEDLPPPPRPSRSQPEESEDFGDRRGGRGARRGGVRGVRGCYICQEEGHISRNCPKASREMNCYNCQKPGHMAKDCPEEPRPRGDRRSTRHGRDDPRDEESHGDSWGGSNWEATPRSQGWGPSDKMHVDDNKWE